MQTNGAVDRSLLLGTLHGSARDSLLPLDFGISLLDFGLSACPIKETRPIFAAKRLFLSLPYLSAFRLQPWAILYSCFAAKIWLATLLMLAGEQSTTLS